MMVIPMVLAAGAVLALSSGARASDRVPADVLLDHLVGRWTMTGTVMGKAVTYRAEGARILCGKFVELHMEDVARPSEYEAFVSIGVDEKGERCVAHWLDSFGAEYSVPAAEGEARGDTLVLRFAYAAGPFRDTFVFDRAAGTWNLHIESSDSTRTWSTFARYSARSR